MKIWILCILLIGLAIGVTATEMQQVTTDLEIQVEEEHVPLLTAYQNVTYHVTKCTAHECRGYLVFNQTKNISISVPVYPNDKTSVIQEKFAAEVQRYVTRNAREVQVRQQAVRENVNITGKISIIKKVIPVITEEPVIEEPVVDTRGNETPLEPPAYEIPSGEEPILAEETQ